MVQHLYLMTAKSQYVVTERSLNPKGDSRDSRYSTRMHSSLLSKSDHAEVSFLDEAGVLLVQAEVSNQNGTV